MPEDFETSAGKNQLIGNKQFVVYIKIIQKCMFILTEILIEHAQIPKLIIIAKS